MANQSCYMHKLFFLFFYLFCSFHSQLL
jgi:hypothetical protein